MKDNGYKELSLKIEALNSRVEALEKLFLNFDASDKKLNDQLHIINDKLDAFLIYLKTIAIIRDHKNFKEQDDLRDKLYAQIMQKLDKLDELPKLFDFTSGEQ